MLVKMWPAATTGEGKSRNNYYDFSIFKCSQHRNLNLGF
jgi:hypothetical protein